MARNDIYVNKKPPALPPRYCRKCGKRITAVYRAEMVARDDQGRWLMRYTGEVWYRRSEFFCTATCAERFAEIMVQHIDSGMKPSDRGQTWTGVTLGHGKPK